MYKIIWNDNGLDMPGHFRNGNPVDERPREIDADNFELTNVGGYMVIKFTKEDRPVAALTNLPVAIITIADTQE